MPLLPVMLAEDFSGLWIFFLLILLIPVGGALLGLASARIFPKVSLACGVLSSLLGIGVLISLTHAGAPAWVWAIASVPLLCGIGCLVRWNSLHRSD